MTNAPDRATPVSAPLRKRSRWARWARRVLALVAGVAGLVLVLHLPVVQRLLSPLLQRAASAAAGGVVTVSSLDYRLWTGAVHAAGIRLVRPGLEITCASLDVQIRPWRGLVVRATEPRIIFSLSPDARPTPPDLRPWTVLDRFAAIDAVRGALRIQRADGLHALQIEGLEAHATRDGGALVATVFANEIAITRADSVWREAMDARVDIEVPDSTHTVHVRSARVVVGQSLAQLSGELQQISPLIGSAQVAVPAGMSVLRRFAPDSLFSGLGGLEGEIAARADLVADRSGRRITILADAKAVRLAHIGPWDGRIEAHVEGNVLRVDDIDLTAYGGSIRGDGAVSLDGAASDLRARVRDVDLPSVLTSHTDLNVRIASRADADLVLRMSQWDPRTLTTEGTVTFRPLAGPGIPLRGSARLSVADRRAHVSSDALHVRDANLRIHGSVGFDGRLNLRYGVNLASVTSVPTLLADVGVEVPRRNVRGSLDAEGTVTGPLDRWRATARLAGRQFAVDELDLDVEGELHVTPASLRLVRLTASGVDGALSASGDIPMRGTDSWNVAGSIESLRLDDVLTRLGVPIVATSRGRFEVTGRRSDPEVAVTIAADVSSHSASAGGTGAAPVLVDASARATERGVVVDRFSARAGAGTIDGVGRWTARTGAIEARVKLAELRLAAIPGVPPVPDLESVLSGEFQLSGTLSSPTGHGSLSASRTAWREAALPDLRVDLSSDGREVRLEGRVAQAVLLTGRMPLVTPWPLRLDVDLAALPMVEILRVFPQLAERDASATVTGRGLVDLELGSPSRVHYEAHVEGAEGRFNESWKAGPFSVRGNLDAVSVRDLEMQFGFGRLRIDGQIGLNVDASDALVVAGTAPLSYLALITPVEEADGDVVVDVTVTGRVARPSVAGTVRVAGGMVRQGAFRFDDLELLAAMDDRGVEIRQASARIAGGHVRATGNVALQQQSPDRYRLELHVLGVDLTRLSAPREDGPTLTALVDADMRVVSDRLSLDAVRGDGYADARVGIGGGEHTRPRSPGRDDGAVRHAVARAASPGGLGRRRHPRRRGRVRG